MKKSYSFQTEIDLGGMGVRTVEVDYSYDKSIHCLNLMTVYLLEGGRLGAEITDYLNADGENALYEAASRDCAQKVREEAEESAEDEAERQRERMREAAWEIEQ